GHPKGRAGGGRPRARGHPRGDRGQAGRRAGGLGGRVGADRRRPRGGLPLRGRALLGAPGAHGSEGLAGGRLRPFDDARPGGATGSGRREPRIPHVPRDRGGTVVRAVWAIFGRELRAYFFSPLAYVVLFFFLFINGILFSVIIGNLNDPRTPGGPPL